MLRRFHRFPLLFRCLIVAAWPLTDAAAVSAGEIVSLTWHSGVASVAGDIINPPSDPNNDDVAGTSPNSIMVAQKNYTGIGPVDLVFEVIDSGGVTEYLVVEGVFNNTGLDWSGYRLELGFGHGAGFVQSPPGDGLDFDAPDFNSDVDFAPFFPSWTVLEDEIVAVGFQPNFTSAWPFRFHIDVPDGFASFTIRQTPLAFSTVPEPETWLLVAVGCLTLPVVRRFRRPGGD